MKVLLINPPIRESHPPNHYPYGLSLLGACLKKEGMDYDVLDVNGLRLKRNEVVDYLSKKSFEVIGVGGLITTYGYVKWLNETVRKVSPKSYIVIGGGIAAWDPAYSLNALHADIAVKGEGEEVFPEIVRNIHTIREKKLDIPGTTYRDNHGNVITHPPEIIKDIDNLPLPDWDHSPIENYIRNNIDPARELQRGMDVFTGRGCPMNCSFCYHIFGKGVRYRAIENVVSEIKIIKETFNLDHIIFGDELFTFNKRRVLDFCNKYIKLGINMPFRLWGRLDTIDEESIAVLKKAGCISYNAGIESGSPKILKNMNKKIKLQEMERGINLIRDAGIDFISSYIHGMIGENTDTVNESIKFYKKMGLKATPFFINPYPGSSMWTKEIEEKITFKYRTLDNYYKVLGNATQFVINISEVSDRKLKALHKKIIYETHGMKFYTFFVYLWVSRLRKVKDKGFKWTVKRLIKKLAKNTEEFQD
jgi:radical SAM superfamily enzyme YgiQ (UPF0313 family)